jgi:hypothetical protein
MLTHDIRADMPCAAVPCLQVCVAVIREEGSNGDREMAAAVFAAGMEPWDITMSDLIAGRAQLDSFRGIIFVGESTGEVGLCIEMFIYQRVV